MKITERRLPQGAEFVSLLVALALVLVIGILSYRAWVSFGRNTEQVAITRQVVDGTNTLLSYLKNAETGQRGFLLTGEDRYLEPYRRAVVEIPATLNALTNLTANRRPDQVRNIGLLGPLVRNKLDELQQTIELRKSTGLDAALAVVRIDRGKVAMDQIRQVCAEIQSVAYRRLTEYSEESRTSANRLGFVGMFGSIGLFGLLLLSSFTIQRGNHRREQLILDLRESDARTAEARDLLQTTIASIGDGVIATDAAGRITFLNAVAQSLTGWAQLQAIGLPLEEILVLHDEETGAAVESPVTTALREGRIVELADHTCLTSKNRHQYPIDDTAAPIRNAAGGVIGAVLVFRDITQRRKAEVADKMASAELAKHAELLERTNAELQHFAYAASHDLREPLRTITAYAELVQLRGGSQLDKRNADSMRFIIGAAHRMGQLIDALMDYSKAGEVTNKPLHPVRMEEILKRALGNLNGSIENSRAVITHDPLPTVVGDDVHVEQLIQNLIGNALKYRRQDAPLVHLAARQSGNEWIFSVSDNGQGIAPQYQGQIFELFKRLHGQQYPGTGIGLATCKKIVERYGGRIWVESKLGAGSIFFFTLPARTEFYQSASGG